MFEATFESLRNHECPEWFRDVKFGIWLTSSTPTAGSPSRRRTTWWPTFARSFEDNVVNIGIRKSPSETIISEGPVLYVSSIYVIQFFPGDIRQMQYRLHGCRAAVRDVKSRKETGDVKRDFFARHLALQARNP